MHRGYIRMWRCSQDDPLYFGEPFTRWQAWMDLIFLANWKEGVIRKRGIRVIIQRGSVGYSEVALAARWQWSRGKVRRFLSELVVDGKIVQQKNNVTSCFVLINYERYQVDGTTDGTANRTPNRTPNGQQTVQEQEVKEVKEGKEEKKPPISPKGGSHKRRSDVFSEEDKELIEYLNQEAGTGFTVTEGNCKHIHARIREGFTVDDLKDAAYIKCLQSRKGQFDRKYLRPSTIWNGEKFQGYLQEAKDYYEEGNL